jgi:hypothetical protein
LLIARVPEVRVVPGRIGEFAGSGKRTKRIKMWSKNTTPQVMLLFSTFVAAVHLPSVESSSEHQRLPSPPYQWIHPEKTGSSFGNELFALTCPEQAEDIAAAQRLGYLRLFSVHGRRGIRGISNSCRKKWHLDKFDKLCMFKCRNRAEWIIGEHYSWSPNVEPSSTFLTLRSPANRLRSFMEWRTGGCSRKALKEAKLAISKSRAKWKLGKKSCGSYVDFVAGATRLSLEKKISLACQRISLSAWVGLTDYFNASICLLQQLFPHEAHPNSLQNMRKTGAHKEQVKNRDLCSADRIKSMFNSELKAEEVIYSCAVQKFSKQILSFAPKCARYIAISPYESLETKSVLEWLKSRTS